MDIKVWLGIGLVAFVFIMIYDYKNKNRVNKFLKNKKEIIDIFSKVFIAIVTVFIAVEANSISERQVTDSRNETAPLFDISMTDEFEVNGYSEAYELTNEKGIVSYPSFTRTDYYSFVYLNRRVEVRVCIDNANNIDKPKNDNKWYYIPEKQDVSTTEVINLIKLYFKDRTGKDIFVNSQRTYNVSFVDYKNEKFNYYFYYNENDDISLAYTDSESFNDSSFVSSYDFGYSGGFIIREDDSVEERVEDFVDSVLLQYEQYENVGI